MKINGYLANEYLQSTETQLNKSKKKLVMSLIEMSTDKSVDKITVSALAKRAGVDRKTFYLHYRSIDDVYKECDELVARSVGGFMKGIVVCNPKRRFKFFDELNRIIVENLEFFQDFLCSGAYTLFIDRVLSIIKDGLFEIIDNEHPQMSKHDRAMLDICIDGMLSAVLTMYLSWFKDDRSLTLDEIGELSRISAANALNGFAQTYNIKFVDIEPYI